VGYYCGIDIGGTFTDCVILDADGRATIAKSLSTPPNFAGGFLDAVTAGAAKLGLETDEFLAQTDLVLHGTTVGTNILVQQRGARTGLITTRGHRDALLIMRSAGRSKGLPLERLLRVSQHRKPDPIVPPHLIHDVTERVDWAGNVVVPLNEDDVREAVSKLVEQGVEAIAISLLFGYVNTAHERRVREIALEMAPDIFVCCGHELAAKPGEYERTATAAINAYIGPSTSRYVSSIGAQLAERGYRKPLLIMQAAGGVAPSDAAAAAPLFTIGSGPVGGIAGARFLAERVGHRNVITCDMGGTSFDVGLIRDGEAVADSEAVTNQYTYFMPRLAIESIGAGGGSIIRADEGSRTLRVGPDSAGARPGPVCYGGGGTDPTVTDADVVLGYLNPDEFLGGELKLDVDAARGAIERVAGTLEMDTITAAAGAVRIVNHHMGELMRQMTVEQGLDPRDFVVYAYGGAGPVHATGYARELGVKEVVVPLSSIASTWSALGVMSSDVLHVYEHAELLAEPFDGAHLTEIYERLEATALAQLRADGLEDDAIDLVRSAELKFRLQIHRVEVAVPAGPLGAKEMEDLVRDFIERYEAIYGRGSAFVEAGIEIGLLTVKAWGRIRLPELTAAEEAEPSTPEPHGTRDVHWPGIDAFVATPVYKGLTLVPGSRIPGPAIIEMPETTVPVNPEDSARVDEFGNIVVSLDSNDQAAGASGAGRRATIAG
jgi:N-methylhydantoinase A